jgi:uncharacterized protein (TIGR02611 family)
MAWDALRVTSPRPARPAHPARARAIARRRRWLRSRPSLYLAYRVLIAVIGAAIVIGGLILVPLPGPGWLIVFLGVALLGTEFRWAKRLGRWARWQLHRFWAWWRARRAS